ncbi:MAG TPA: hypothetical protein VEF53_10700 [Patescibacteria group bacterium]|nr:hypothetical protein [Patescibacteria group bacterium]
MFSLVRSGPKMLLIESTDINTLKNYMIEQFDAAVEHEFNLAFEKANEDFTILFLTKQMQDIVTEKDIVGTIIIAEESDVILCKLINDNQTALLGKIRTAPRIIMVRALGNMEKVIQEIHADHGGSFGTFMELWNAGNEKGTLVAVTDKPLHRSMRINDLYEKCLYTDQRFYPLFKGIRLHALKYLNKGLGNKDWYEIEIRIYDRYSAYDLHYERLAKVLDFLDLGIILGESWTKDYPRFMMAVGVYRLRFFTFHDPKYIKKMLVGLEHLEDGTRIVDYDVYYQRKKMDWTDARLADDPHLRHLLGLKYRAEIYARLTPQEAESIKHQEEEILKTRY